MPHDELDARVLQHARDASNRLCGNLSAVAPLVAKRAKVWMRKLAGGDDLPRYFLHPAAFPLLSLSRWFAEAQGIAVDEALEAELTYSSLHGGYYVRLVDNVMDERKREERQLLPLLHVLHLEFVRPYAQLFTQEHPFWSDFSRTWGEMADTTLGDALAHDFDRADFERLSARKVCAAEIPVTAAAYRYGRVDALPSWLEFLALLGRWFQMFNDVRDWRTDQQRGIATWLNSEARRRQGSGTKEMVTFMHERGLEWACSVLSDWHRELDARAAALGAVHAQQFVSKRWLRFEQQAEELRVALPTLLTLHEVFAGSQL